MLFVIAKKDEGRVLRSFLKEIGVSAALLAKLKRKEGGVLQNGHPVTVRALLKEGDCISLAVEDEEPPGHVLPRELPISVLSRTADYAVLNKPYHMPTHPSHGHFEDTLANALAYHFSTPNAPFCPRFINRLDRNTTGVVLVAMHALSASVLCRAMASGQMQKSYLALVHGMLEGESEIVTGIRRRQESIIFREVCSTEAGERAITGVQPLATNGEITLVRLLPRTGRTHQLRVHMAHIGHPLLGDELYGVQDGFPRHALHAASLCFPDPCTGEQKTVYAPMPEDMMAVVQTLGKEAASFALLQTSPEKCE